MQEFLDRARAAVGNDGRLVPGAMASWDVFPFETEGLRVRPLEEYADPEPDRRRTPDTCGTCAALSREDLVLATGEQLAVIRPDGCNLPFVANVVSRRHIALDDLDDEALAEMGVLVGRTYRALTRIEGIGNVHVNKWENGGGHLSVTLLARPCGVLQLRGSNLAAWADMLPATPAAELAARAEQVREDLARARPVA